jgi:hypothetical protein
MIVRRRGATHRSSAIDHYAARVRRGLGQDDTTYTQFDTGSTDVSIPTYGTTSPVVDLNTGAPVSPSSPGFDWSKLIGTLSTAGVAATRAYQSLQTPGLVPGTQAIYNPQTGQFYNPTTGQVVSPSGGSFPSVPGVSSPILLIGGLLVGGLILFSVMGKH